MDERQWIRSLDDRGAEAPRVDVAAWVVRDLESMRRESAPAAFAWAAGLGAIAATAAVILAVQSMAWLSDPLSNVVVSFSTVMQ